MMIAFKKHLFCSGYKNKKTILVERYHKIPFLYSKRHNAVEISCELCKMYDVIVTHNINTRKCFLSLGLMLLLINLYKRR